MSPKYISLGPEVSFSVSFHDIQKPAQLFTVFEYRDTNGLFCGQQHHLSSIEIISDAGMKSLKLPLIIPADAATIRISVGLYDLPTNGNGSIYHTTRRAPSISSAWLPISRDGSNPIASAVSISNIISRAYGQGFWRTQRGDYTLAGWGITLSYAVCVFFFIYCLKGVANHDASERLFWRVLFMVVLLLCINKQLDLQMLITDIARTAAKELQVYEFRKPIQIKVISFFASMAIGLFCLVGMLVRQAHKGLLLALAGISVITGYLFLRLMSYHSVDAMLGRKLFIFSLFDVIEFLGILLIGAGVVWYGRTYQRMR